MKNIIILFLLTSIATNAQVSEKEIKKHNKTVLESKAKNNGVYSLDTLFCSGVPTAKVKILEKSFLLGVEEQIFSSLNESKPLIIVTIKSFMNPQNIQTYFYQYDFPALNRNCDILVTLGEKSVYEVVCKYGLINEKGLDTMKAETFVAMKGNVITPSSNLTNNITEKNEYAVQVNRNTQSFLFITGDNIVQDQKHIGKIIKTTVKNVNGLTNQYQIYNVNNILICTATESELMSRKWNLLIYKSNKFFTLESEFAKDQDTILKYLIELGYL